MDRVFRQYIKVQSAVTTKNSYGDKVISSYTDYLTARARWMHTGGTETFRGRQVQADVVGVFEIRYHPSIAITPDMFVLWEGTRYGITSVRPAECKTEGGYKTIEIYVKAIA